METDELTAILQEVRERVRARHPESSAMPLPDLMPLLRARDAAEAKVASIGTVNPRAGGPLNGLIQTVKKTVARALDWHVREQVEFNRNVLACVQASLEALEETRRTLGSLGQTQAEIQELRDIRSHWVDWRQEWEHRLMLNETKLLRGLAELNAAFQYRTGQTESFFRDQVKLQHADFTAAVERSGVDIQKRLWADLERIRLDYERLIHAELRVVRQRAAVSAPAATAPAPLPGQAALSGQAALIPFDYGRFAERFRGSEEYVRNGQRFYLPYFADRRDVLDIGCGRGEFLELMREAGVPACGIDLSRESVDLCRHKGLQAEIADLFTFLADLPEASLDGIFSAQVVEHLPPERLPEMIRLAASRLRRDGLLAIETPNPECLAIFATHFYLDPTHTRPVPHALLAFYMEEYGLGRIEVHQLSPAMESMPALAESARGISRRVLRRPGLRDRGEEVIAHPPREVEIKLAVPGAAEGHRLLLAAGFRVSKPRVFEANTLFDTAQGALGRAGRLLRVRQAGSVGILTYKGPETAGKYKEREELEVEVSDTSMLMEMLARLGFIPSLHYEKYRTEYRRPGEAGVATLDETPIGVYVELEGAPQWIDRNARRMGFKETAYITASYYGLYADYCRKHRAPAGGNDFCGRAYAFFFASPRPSVSISVKSTRRCSSIARLERITAVESFNPTSRFDFGLWLAGSLQHIKKSSSSMVTGLRSSSGVMMPLL